MPHIIFDGQSNVNARRYSPVRTQVMDLACRDGGSLLQITQPEYPHAEPGDPVAVYLDDDAQLAVLKHLKAKFEV